MYTIGFRGLGFKSTFSLGSRVELYTPTLAVAFEEARFTEPIWLDGSRPSDLTRIVIRMTRAELTEQVNTNLRQSVESPLPLLFFRHIREIELQGETMT